MSRIGVRGFAARRPPRLGSTHLVIHNSNGIAYPGTEMIHLDDAPAGDGVVMGTSRLVIVVALPAPANAATTSQSAPKIVPLDYHRLVLAGIEIGLQRGCAHRHRSRIGGGCHGKAPQCQCRQGGVQEAVEALGECVMRYED
jgi:hypothetical protein